MIRKPKALIPKETDIVKACLQYLNLVGVFAWRSNTGAVSGTYKGKDRFIRFGPKGQSDIIGILPDGRFLAVEVKRPGGKLTFEQDMFLDTIRKRGGVALHVQSLQECEDWVREAMTRGKG